MNYNCEKCGKNFKTKYNLTYHLNKKNSCDGIIVYDDIDMEEIKNKDLQKYLNECKCIFCDKKFTRRDHVMVHIKNNCKKAKYNINKMEEYDKIKKLEEENKLLKETLEKKIEKKIESKYSDEIKELKKNIDELKLKKETNINTNNNVDNIDIDINNNINNIQNNALTLNNYNGQAMPPLTHEELLPIFKRGFQAPVELTKLIHFNEKYPEFHNFFLPRYNEKHGLIYKNNNWNLINKDELVDDIYDNKRDFINQNYKKFEGELDDKHKRSLQRFLSKDVKDDSVKNTKEDIKKVIYDYRGVAMKTKKTVEKQLKKKELNVFNLLN
jgi:hypothetical protein